MKTKLVGVALGFIILGGILMLAGLEKKKVAVREIATGIVHDRVEIDSADVFRGDTVSIRSAQISPCHGCTAVAQWFISPKRISPKYDTTVWSPQVLGVVQ